MQHDMGHPFPYPFNQRWARLGLMPNERAHPAPLEGIPFILVCLWTSVIIPSTDLHTEHIFVVARSLPIFLMS